MTTRRNLKDPVLELHRKHPDWAPVRIAAELGFPRQSVSLILQRARIGSRRMTNSERVSMELSTAKLDTAVADAIKSLPPLSLNHERLGPVDVPTELKSFLAWAQYACIEWPSDLQRLSGLAWQDMCCVENRLMKSEEADASFDRFITGYTRWYAKTETEKDDLSPSKDHDRRRQNRARARNGAVDGY